MRDEDAEEEKVDGRAEGGWKRSKWKNEEIGS